MKKTSTIILMVVIAAVFAVAGFFGGMQFQRSKNSAGRFATEFQNGNFAGARQGNGSGAGMRAGNRGANFIAGEIISKDDKSLTLKLAAGGSKIILFSTSTELTKFATTSLENLNIGENISVNGTANSDGSVTAQSIQMRPLFEAPSPNQQIQPTK
ncbi:MAG: hypothetical protein WCV92_00230 [Candidatus Buchananbacteria bacterium]